jgi:hypothetical protein
VGDRTVTDTKAVDPPPVAAIVVVPGAIPVTMPAEASMVATLGSAVLQWRGTAFSNAPSASRALAAIVMTELTATVVEP